MSSNNNKEGIVILCGFLFITLILSKNNRKFNNECFCCCSNQQDLQSHSKEDPKVTINNNEEQENIFEVFVSPSDRFKFNAAHFIAYRGFRERLHGHNYSVAIKMVGRTIGHDGYLIDFGDVKELVSRLCKELNEHFLLPTKSDCLKIEMEGSTVRLTCEDGQVFLLPKDDIVELPIVHSSAEEIAVYLWNVIVDRFSVEKLHSRGIFSLEVAVAEMPNQQATFRSKISNFSNNSLNLPYNPKGCFSKN